MTRNQIKAVTTVAKRWFNQMTPEERFEFVADVLEALERADQMDKQIMQQQLIQAQIQNMPRPQPSNLP